MLYIKKYFTEGLIQMAILLSLCALRVDVGLEPYVPLFWHEMILGPTSVLTQTQFHNLRNSLEDGQHLHTKTVDLDSFFTARRLLGWVHSLDRLQVPPAEVETWLVQKEPDPLSLGYPDQPSLLERDSTGEEREQVMSAVEPRDGPSSLQEQEYTDIGARRSELEPYPIGSEPQFPVLPSDDPCLDLELQWQDLVDIMEPENKDFGMMTSFDHTQHSTPYETPQDVGFEALHQNCNNLEANQEVQLMETSPQHGLLSSLRQRELEHALLPLTPSAQLDDQSSAFNNSNFLTLDSPPNHLDLLAEDFSVELNADNNWSVFNMNFLAPDFVAGSPSEQCPPFTENGANADVSFYSRDLKSSASATSQEGNDMTQELLAESPESPFSVFLDHKEQNFGVDDDLRSPLRGLLEDVAMLDDIRLLDLALDEAFNPETAASLEEEVRENESQPRHQQDSEDEADSDSGLSLDFSYSPASPCVSEASSDSSSSSSLSHSSSSCVSAVESLLSKDSDNDMEVEVTVKQEEEEEDIGAVGGWHSEVFNYKDHKLFNSFHWQEHTYHDHTYNQPCSSASSSRVGKMPTKNTKSSLHDKIRPYHYSSKQISKTSVWSRDERRSQALKIPFSNELIVNLPVEEFNNLLTNYQLNEEQVTLIRHIRRRGKNKIAAQNCRERKLYVLLGLEDEVSCLTRHRLRLLREKREVLKKLQEMKRQLGTLYQEVFSRLRDQNGRPLSTTEYLLHFGSSGSVTVASHQQEALLHMRGEKTSKKQKGKKK